MGEGRKQDNELIPVSDESKILRKTENTCGIIPCDFICLSCILCSAEHSEITYSDLDF